MIRYNKVSQIGDVTLDRLLVGEVIVEEKLDGSQFRISIEPDGTLHFGSKSVDTVDSMFSKGVEGAKTVFKDFIPDFQVDIFAEYFVRPHHNTLKYDRVPKHNIAVFDVKVNGNWLSYEEKKRWANEFDLEVVPLVFRGDGGVLNSDKINELLKTRSALGDVQIEGIVVKNYNQYFDFVKFPFLQGMCMIGKYVREEFKEMNRANWKEIKKGPVEVLIDVLRTDARWMKAFQHLRDEGKLSNSVKDIPDLIREVHRDIEEEEKENIKNALYDHYWREIRGGAIRGLPEWYKQRLLQNIDGDTT